MELLEDKPQLVACIHQVAAENDFKNYIITNIQTNAKGEGFMGDILMVTISEKNTDRHLDLVIKSAFKSEKNRSLAPIRASFLNEICFYTEIYPRMETLLKSISKKPLIPRCFKVCSEENSEFLCFENLKSSGFEVFDKRQIVNDEHQRLIFETYGRLHGYSFGLKHLESEFFESVTEKLFNVFGRFTKSSDEGFPKFLKNMSQIVYGFLTPGEDDVLIEKYQKYLDANIVEIFINIAREKSDEFNIIHGDCWSNNMMFKYNTSESDKKVVDMRLIDLQIIKAGSPVCDLSYALYSGGSLEEYNKLDEYLDIYHTSLSKTLRELNCDPNEIYPMRLLKEHWKKYARFGMIMSIGVIRMKTARENVEDLTDFLEKGDKAPSRYNETEYKRRILDLLYHMHEIDAL